MIKDSWACYEEINEIKNYDISIQQKNYWLSLANSFYDIVDVIIDSINWVFKAMNYNKNSNKEKCIIYNVKKEINIIFNYYKSINNKIVREIEEWYHFDKIDFANEITNIIVNKFSSYINGIKVESILDNKEILQFIKKYVVKNLSSVELEITTNLKEITTKEQLENFLKDNYDSIQCIKDNKKNTINYFCLDRKNGLNFCFILYEDGNFDYKLNI